MIILLDSGVAIAQGTSPVYFVKEAKSLLLQVLETEWTTTTAMCLVSATWDRMAEAVVQMALAAALVTNNRITRGSNSSNTKTTRMALRASLGQVMEAGMTLFLGLAAPLARRLRSVGKEGRSRVNKRLCLAAVSWVMVAGEMTNATEAEVGVVDITVVAVGSEEDVGVADAGEDGETKTIHDTETERLLQPMRVYKVWLSALPATKYSVCMYLRA